MSQTLTTMVQNLEKGYVKMIRFDTDKILYASGKRSKVSTTLDFPCETPEALAKNANGGKTFYLNFSDITRFRTRSDKKTIDIGFKDAKGRSCTIDIDASNLATKEFVAQTVGGVLEGSGFEKSQRPASAFSVSWRPALLMLGTLVIGGLFTAAQATGEGLHPEEEGYGGGRSVRRARGLRILIASVTNLLGFWGCLIISSVVFLAALFYLFRKLANRPIVTVLSPK